MMSRKEREALRELCAKATPGPWSFIETGSLQHAVFATEAGDIAFSLHQQLEEIYDAPFIAAARTALPQLLNEYEELLRRVREYLKECPGCDGNGIHRRIKTSGFINPTHALIKEPCKVCTALREYVREDAE